MNTDDIIRAWKDEEFRREVAVDQLAQLPASPVGAVELSDADLGAVAGGAKTVGIACDLASLNNWCSMHCSSWSCFPHNC